MKYQQCHNLKDYHKKGIYDGNGKEYQKNIEITRGR